MSFLAETFFMESVDEGIKELNMIAEEANINFMKIDQMFAMVEAQREINIAASELKVVTESGTVDDLEMLYEAANAEAAGKKEGIIKRGINAIKEFFGKIIDFINEKILKRTGSISDSVAIDKSFVDNYNKVMKDHSEIKGDIAKLKGGQDVDFKKIALIGGATAAGAAAGTIIIKKTDLMSKIQNLLKISKESEEMLNVNGEKLSEGTRNALEALQNSGKNINDVVKEAYTATLSNLGHTGDVVYSGIENIIGASNALQNVPKSDKKAAAKNIGNARKRANSNTKNGEDGNEVTESAQDTFEDGTEDIFGADYTYESAMSELEQMIDDL